jgi:hypothetical protein
MWQPLHFLLDLQLILKRFGITQTKELATTAAKNSNIPPHIQEIISISNLYF